MPKIPSLPNQSAQRKLAEITSFNTNRDRSTRYWLNQMVKQYANEKVPLPENLAAVLQRVEKQAIANLQAAQRIWNGDYLATNDTLNIQHALADEALAIIEKENILAEDLNHDIAISEQGEYMRAFSTGENNLVSPESTDALDTLFNHWLAEQGYISKESRIFEMDENGKIKLDEDGKPIAANKEDIEQKLTDPRVGFETYMKDKGARLTVYERPYEKAKTQEAAPAEKAPVVESTTKPVASKEEATEQKQEPDSGTSPTSSSS